MTTASKGAAWSLICPVCGARFDGFEVRHRCACGEPLEVERATAPTLAPADADARLVSRSPLDRSGVWRFREWVLPVDEAHVVTRQEGHTNLYPAPQVARWVGLDALHLKHEGENPTASFKDRGMTVAVSMARCLGRRRVACASTGNTSASMASYAAVAGMDAFVFIPEGKVAFGKLSQAMAFGAKTLQIAGDFDRAMKLVETLAREDDLYLVNSINPFRIEGQKAIAFELLQDLEWNVPDWVVLPGGNLGNNSAIARGFVELRRWGVIDRLPRIAVIQASGANPLYAAFSQGKKELVPVEAETLATAIRIGNPVSWRRSLRGLEATGGVVEEVTDQDIVDAKVQVDTAGIGAEPASCATVAGTKKLVERGVIGRSDRVCGILTGHLLKDPGTVVDYHRGALAGIASPAANPPIRVRAELPDVRAALGL